MKKVTQITILVAIACILIGCAVALTALAVVGFDFSRLSSVKQVSNTYVIEEEVRSIDIRTSAANIVFAPSADDRFTVECVQGDRITLNVEVVGDTLRISEQDNRKWYEYIGIFYYDAQITVYIPNDEEDRIFNRLYLETSSGDITITDPSYRFTDAELRTLSGDILYHAPASKTLTIETGSGNVDAGHYPLGVVQINTSSGDVSLPTMSGSYVSVSTSSGKVTAKQADALSLDISTSSGNVTLSETALGTLTVYTSSGNLSVQDVDVRTNTQLHTSSGDIRLNGFDAETIGIKTSSGKVTCHLLSPKNFIVHTNSGSVNIPRSEPLAGNCEIATTSGNIRIEIIE